VRKHDKTGEVGLLENWDRVATKEKLESTGRNVAGWARASGFDPERMRKVFRGEHKIRPEEVAALKKDNLLVKVKK
jgi:hypothetical protein